MLDRTVLVLVHTVVTGEANSDGEFDVEHAERLGCCKTGRNRCSS